MGKRILTGKINMRELNKKRCKNHGAREAVARCPECGRFFCRECITEHEERMLCAGCLGKILKKTEPGVLRPVRILQAVLFFVGIIMLWLSFYAVGRILLGLPGAFHEGTLWKEVW